jgi:hypothetical protein
VQAVDLVLRASDFCYANAESALVREASVRLQGRTQHLIDVLASELSTEKSFQGGPRAARCAVQLLCKLGRSTQATDLFLQYRAAILLSSMRSGKVESATVTYVQRQAVAFFAGIIESSVEFRKAFCGKVSTEEDEFKMSSLLVWIHDQMSKFFERIEKQIFSPSTPLETIAVCVEVIRKQCANLSDSGLDLLFLVDAQLRRNVERTVRLVKLCVCILLLIRVVFFCRYASTETSTWTRSSCAPRRTSGSPSTVSTRPAPIGSWRRWALPAFPVFVLTCRINAGCR